MTNSNSNSAMRCAKNCWDFFIAGFRECSCRCSWSCNKMTSTVYAFFIWDIHNCHILWSTFPVSVVRKLCRFDSRWVPTLLTKQQPAVSHLLWRSQNCLATIPQQWQSNANEQSTVTSQLTKYVSINCPYDPSVDCFSFWSQHQINDWTSYIIQHSEL